MTNRNAILDLNNILTNSLKEKRPDLAVVLDKYMVRTYGYLRKLILLKVPEIVNNQELMEYYNRACRFENIELNDILLTGVYANPKAEHVVHLYDLLTFQDLEDAISEGKVLMEKKYLETCLEIVKSKLISEDKNKDQGSRMLVRKK